MWFTSLFGRSTSSRSTSPRRPAARARLGVETLEGRAAPAALGLGSAWDGSLLLEDADRGRPALVQASKKEENANPIVPWRLVAEGQILVSPNGTLTPTWSGVGSHIGRYTASATLIVAANGQDVSGAGSYVAANGDRIDFTYSGRFDFPIGSVAVNPFNGGTAHFQGGSGRFANAVGDVTFSGVLRSDLTFNFTHNGTLSY